MSDAATYVPRADDAEDLQRLVDSLLTRDRSTGTRAALVAEDGTSIELPAPVFDILVDVARAMARGEGISVVPRHQQLTTQEAADLLGISRPTLVGLLERGEISFTRVGRHRRVTLEDLLDYQSRARKDRADRLDRVVGLGEDAELYERTDGPPLRTR